MAASRRGGVLALIPLAQAEGPPVLERVHARDGKLKRTVIRAGKTPLGAGAAVSDSMVLAISHNEDELEESLFVASDTSQAILARTIKGEHASKDGLYLAGTFSEPWKFGSKKFLLEDCDDENSACIDAFILALDPKGKLRWGLQLGREYRDDEVGPIASHPQGGVAVRVAMDEEDEYQIGAQKIPLDSNTLLKLTHEGEVQWSARPSFGIRDMVVTASGEIYALGLESKHHYVDGKREYKTDLILGRFDKGGNVTVQRFGDPAVSKRFPKIAVSPKGQVYLAWTRAHKEESHDAVLMLVEEKAKP